MMENMEQNRLGSSRRDIFRRLVGLTVLGALGAVALERLPVPVSAATAGDVAFSDGTASGVTFDHANFFWDDTNKRLGIGTSSPLTAVHAYQNIAGQDAYIAIQNAASGKAAYLAASANSGFVAGSFYSASIPQNWVFGMFGNSTFTITDNTNGKTPFQVNANSPTNSLAIAPSGVGIGTPSPAQMLSVAGDVGQSVVAANGLVKAAALVNGSTPAIIRGFNNLPGGSGPSVSQPLGPGTYEVNFGVNVAQRFFSATLLSSNSTDPGGAIEGEVLVSTTDGNANAVFVRTNDSTGTHTNRSFYLMIF